MAHFKKHTLELAREEVTAEGNDLSRTSRLVRSVPWAVIVISIIIAAIAMASLWNISLKRSQVELDRLSLSAAKQTQWYFDRLDKLLTLGSNWLARMGEVENIANLRLYERFQPPMRSMEGVESIIVSNDEGTLRVITRDVVAVPATAFDPRALFDLYRNSPELNLVIGEAFWLQSGKTWAFPISRPILDPEGKLVGAITALVRADVLGEQFNSIKPDDSVRVLLLNGDGHVLVGRGDENAQTNAQPDAIAVPQSGFLEHWSGLPGAMHLAYIRDLNGFPLHLVAAQSRIVYQQRFRHDALLLIGLAIAAGVGLAAIAGILGGRILAAHRRLREERDFIDTVMDSTDAIVLVLDRSGAIVRHNATFAKLASSFGGDLPRTLFDLCKMENAEQLSNALKRALELGRGDFESNLAGAWDRPVTVKWAVSPLPKSSGAADLVCFGIDITELRQSFRALARTNAAMEHVLALAKAYYWVARPNAANDDLDPSTIIYSSGAAEFYCCTEAELRAPTTNIVARFVHPDDQASVKKAFRDFQRGDARRFEHSFRLRRQDGGYRHCISVAEKVLDSNGRVLEIIGVEQDISEQRRRELDLINAKREAEIANRAKTEFLANMSHELRTPLNAVIGFSQLIRDQAFGSVNERYVGYAGDIYRSGMMLLELINDILDLSRVETGRLRISEDMFALLELMRDCAKIVSAAAKDGGVSVRILEPDAALHVRADQRAMRQVLLNILSNAVKFTPKGGTVTISAQVVESGDLELRVADTGIGIDPNVIKDLFQPFRQADSQISRRYGGTGLGLAISRSLAQLHGGDIKLKSQPGQGTIVTVELPAERVILAMDDGRKLARRP